MQHSDLRISKVLLVHKISHLTGCTCGGKFIAPFSSAERGIHSRVLRTS